MSKLINTWSITSQFNKKAANQLGISSLILQDSSIKGLCHIDSYPDTSFLKKKDVQDILSFENFLITKPYQSIKIYNSRISSASVINFRNYDQLKKKIKKNFKILEIGAGIGYLAALIKFMKKDCTYFICDLPSTLNLSHRFLKNNFPKLKIKYIKNLQNYRNPKLDIILIDNKNIKNLKEKFDLIINIDSFSEMDKQDVDFYIDFASRNLKKNGSFFLSNTHGHANESYDCPIDYPFKDKFLINSYSYYNPSARDNPCKYINLDLLLKKKNKSNNDNLHIKIKKIFYNFSLKEKNLATDNQSFFYEYFRKKNMKKIKNYNFSTDIKRKYFIKLSKIYKSNFELERQKLKSLDQKILYYFYNPKIFYEIYPDLIKEFYNSKNYLDKIKYYYVIAKEKKNISKETRYLFKLSISNTYKRYFLLLILSLGKFKQFKFYSKKLKVNNIELIQHLNYFNFSKRNKLENFKNTFKIFIKSLGINYKNLDKLILDYKLKILSFNQLKLYMKEYHNNYYSIGYLLKKTLFILNQEQKTYFIQESVSLRNKNLQNINFLFEIMYFSKMFYNAKNTYLKHNLKKYFFYSELKYEVIKQLNTKNAKLIYDESSLMINNGTTCFLPFLNVGNNNIVISNN